MGRGSGKENDDDPALGVDQGWHRVGDVNVTGQWERDSLQMVRVAPH